MNKSSLEKRVENSLKEISKEVRIYFKKQKDDLQKIPWLALQANGRGGYSSTNQWAYELGLWKINYSIVVDLESGDLLCSSWNGEKIDLAQDLDLYLLAPSLRGHYAKGIINDLKRQLEYEDNEFYQTEWSPFDRSITVNEWRESLAKEYGLIEGKYSRKEKLIGDKRRRNYS